MYQENKEKQLVSSVISVILLLPLCIGMCIASSCSRNDSPSSWEKPLESNGRGDVPFQQMVLGAQAKVPPKFLREVNIGGCYRDPSLSEIHHW